MRTRSLYLAGLLAVLSTAVISSVTYANDSAIAGVGGSWHPLKGEHRHVRMVRETIRINVGKTYYDTIADFTFHNDGPKATVPMGFPESGGGDVDAEHYKTHTAFTNFRSWIDGKKVDVKRVNTNRATEEIYEALWVKNVPFRRGQTRHVRVSYRSKLGSAIGIGLERLVSYDFTGGNWRGDVAESRLSVTIQDPGYYLASVTLGDSPNYTDQAG